MYDIYIYIVLCRNEAMRFQGIFTIFRSSWSSLRAAPRRAAKSWSSSPASADPLAAPSASETSAASAASHPSVKLCSRIPQIHQTGSRLSSCVQFFNRPAEISTPAADLTITMCIYMFALGPSLAYLNYYLLNLFIFDSMLLEQKSS